MAYLKGGTYVDGDFYVEGALRINSLTDLEGRSFPAITGEVKDKYLVSFSGTSGGLTSSQIKVEDVVSGSENDLKITVKPAGDESEKELLTVAAIAFEGSVAQSSGKMQIKNIAPKYITCESASTEVWSSGFTLHFDKEVPYWDYE